MSEQTTSFWFLNNNNNDNINDTSSSSLLSQKVVALGLGTGRLLRSVWVPCITKGDDDDDDDDGSVILLQPRGNSFVEYMKKQQQLEQQEQPKYEIDTLQVDGTTSTSYITNVIGAASLGADFPEARHEIFESILPQLYNLQMIAVGVTEAGLANAKTPAMQDLYQILKTLSTVPSLKHKKLILINTDNVPQNGEKIQEYMKEILLLSCQTNEDPTTTTEMAQFLSNQVIFCNSMVDRITSARPNSNGMVPLCEPLPRKALVLCPITVDHTESDGKDNNNVSNPSITWPADFVNQPGVIIRKNMEELEMDIRLKLKIANGTHTAIAHGMALCGHAKTDILTGSKDIDNHDNNNNNNDGRLWLEFLDQLAEHQILKSCCSRRCRRHGDDDDDDDDIEQEEAFKVWQDWRSRLLHPHFGLSTWFITQNGTAKGGIRWGPTVKDLVSLSITNMNEHVQVSMALCYAMLLRWLTPLPESYNEKKDDDYNDNANIFRGWLDGMDPNKIAAIGSTEDTSATEEYAQGLHYNLKQGWYEFHCPLKGLPNMLQNCTGRQPSECVTAVECYLFAQEGGNLTRDSSGLDALIGAIAVYYSRMIAGDSIQDILQELSSTHNGITWTTPCSELAVVVSRNYTTTSTAFGNGGLLHYRPSPIPDMSRLLVDPVIVTASNMAAVVQEEVQSVVAIDLHTHLLPPSHGSLCLWGIDDLLTYHYLVAEYFMTAPASMTPEYFYAQSKETQASWIWQALFVDRTPISEACRGVLTTLQRLGLSQALRNRDLEAIRDHFATLNVHEYCESVFVQAGIEYAIMTNIPFDAMEVQYWRPNIQEYSKRFRSALRVDPLLMGDRDTILATLQASGFECSIQGAKQYLLDWIDTMQPEYLMASTPHDFVVRDSAEQVTRRTAWSEKALQQPGAFASVLQADRIQTCEGGSGDDNIPTLIDETSDFLSQVLIPVAMECDLPIALKIGAHRGINPRLKAAGDGVVAFCDCNMLARLCTKFPQVRFLATFLSKNNQHEACVLANKFRNLHLYGCWWYCNNPSIIREISQMRIEMLGTAFTAQHSDARVVDQLLYKWPHSRGILARVLQEQYSKVLESGWKSLTRHEVRREVRRLFRGSYEEFMQKSLKEQ